MSLDSNSAVSTMASERRGLLGGHGHDPEAPGAQQSEPQACRPGTKTTRRLSWGVAAVAAILGAAIAVGAVSSSTLDSESSLTKDDAARPLAAVLLNSSNGPEAADKVPKAKEEKTHTKDEDEAGEKADKEANKDAGDDAGEKAGGKVDKKADTTDSKKADKAKEDSKKGKKGKAEDHDEVPAPGTHASTFYVYRAQSAAKYPLENLNVADLPGVLWYLHNEVVTSTPRKYKIDRIRRYRITVKNTREFWNAHKRQFGAFVAYDAGRCTTPVCKDIYHQYGFIVGCQVVDTKLAAYYSSTQTNWNCAKGSRQCNAPLWYALPGPCPSMGMTNERIHPNEESLDVNHDKTHECMQRMPGGRCSKASGAPDCTYSYEDAGEVLLDELTGITDYNEFWNTSYTKCAAEVARHERKGPCRHNKEYDMRLDRGVGCDFWNGKTDQERCDGRIEATQELFKKKYPHLPKTYEAPACDFDMYYKDEFKWEVNHTGAATSDWWSRRLDV